MADDKKQDLKKNFSNSFIWFLMAAFFLALMVQNFLDTNFAKVSFSYQLESLVDLQLIQPEDSRKTAINDNLVTFSGKFRERLTEEGKNRYKFLELLNTNHELTGQKERLEKELNAQKIKIADSADWFLHLSGIALPKNGYIIVDTIFSNPEKDNSVVITELSSKKIASLEDLKNQYDSIATHPSPIALRDYGKQLSDLISAFRSPMLGIGNEPIKQKLKAIDKKVDEATNNDKLSVNEKLSAFGAALADLKSTVDEIDQFEDHVRLDKLRSVRNYQDSLEEYTQLSAKLDDNMAQLEKARQTVANVIWYYNNQELSTRALEKQDPEQFNHWFITAKEEWDSFPANRGGIFKAPDQPLNTVLEKTFKSEEPTPNYFSYLLTALPLLLIMLVLYFVFSRQMKGMGTNAMNFGKSPAKLLVKGANKVTFKDVAGIDEAREELQEIVDFLKSPQKFTALGGHIPKGVLCIGPPRYRQNADRKSRRRRSRQTLFLDLRFRLRRNVCGRRSQPYSRPLRSSQKECPLHCFH